MFLWNYLGTEQGDKEVLVALSINVTYSISTREFASVSKRM